MSVDPALETAIVNVVTRVLDQREANAAASLDSNKIADMVTKRLDEKKKLDKVTLEKKGNQQQYDHGLEVLENYNEALRSTQKQQRFYKMVRILYLNVLSSLGLLIGKTG